MPLAPPSRHYLHYLVPHLHYLHHHLGSVVRSGGSGGVGVRGVGEVVVTTTALVVVVDSGDNR